MGSISSGWWKFKEDYVVREWKNVHGDTCQQMGNVWCSPERNWAGGVTIRETFVCTKDQ